jgi:hypoxanthine-DNA glycosylase
VLIKPTSASAEAAAELLRGFPPVYRPDARVLILGSLPGAQSLARQSYYANSRNQFWQLVGSMIGVDLVGCDYADRLATLIAHRIALWDVVSTGHRPGSLDADLKIAERSDLAGLVARLPDLRAIAFNGQLAARQAADAGAAVELITLPSSSPAHTLPLAQKQTAWNAIGRHLS